jgi:hypothetical protein
MELSPADNVLSVLLDKQARNSPGKPGTTPATNANLVANVTNHVLEEQKRERMGQNFFLAL